MNKKYKRMTLKEFKDAFENVAGMSMDIWGYEGILNCIAIMSQYEAREDARLGCSSISSLEQDRCDRITEYLKARGYYDNKNA